MQHKPDTKPLAAGMTIQMAPDDAGMAENDALPATPPAMVERFMVGVVVERRASTSPWVDHVWAPVQVLPDAPDIAPFTSLGTSLGTSSPSSGHPPGRERFYLGAAEVTLYRSDTGHFADNFLSATPQLWVAIRPTGIEPALELVGVTADPHEGEGYGGQVGDIVEPLPMPAGIAARVAAFYREHHVEQVFVKRKRHETDPRKGGIRPASGLERGGPDRQGRP